MIEVQKALKGNDEVVDIHHAGTDYAISYCFFAVNEGREVVLTGSQRMTDALSKF
jgi:3-phosphoshikimate 1-carboxyvinyltransferase